jgi:hypothetical protein
MRKFVILFVLALAGCDSQTDEQYIAPDDDASVDAGTCPENFGWPCSCDVPLDLCADDTICMILPDEDVGICSPVVPCPETDYPGIPVPYWDENGWPDPNVGHYCALACDVDSDCPDDQSCNGDICYP